MSNFQRNCSIPAGRDPWFGGWDRIHGVATGSVFAESLSALEVPRGSYRDHQAARRIQPSLVYMFRHLNEPLSVSALSRIAHISPSHFFGLFKQATGETPIQFLIRARMRRAQKLVQETGLTVKEIAAQLGYGDEFYFSRQFKSFYGLAPSHYRDARKKLVAGRKAADSKRRTFTPVDIGGESDRSNLDNG